MIARRSASLTLHVLQEHDTGCAIACVATIVGRSYDEVHGVARTRLGRSLRSDKSLWDHEIVELLRVHGTPSRFARWHVLDHRPAILMFDWDPGERRSSTHCVVWDPGSRTFIDPGHGNPSSELPRGDLWRKSGRHAVVITAPSRRTVGSG